MAYGNEWEDTVRMKLGIPASSLTGFCPSTSHLISCHFTFLEYKVRIIPSERMHTLGPVSFSAAQTYPRVEVDSFLRLSPDKAEGWVNGSLNTRRE